MYHQFDDGFTSTAGERYHWNNWNCGHWRQPVKVGRRQVWCSSYRSGTIDVLKKEPVPDYGVYLYSGWQDKVPMVTNGFRINMLAKSQVYPMLFVAWRDMGTLPAQEIDTLVEICIKKMRQGKILDIACQAGHGRTGSLLACIIAQVEHVSGDEAIRQVRSRYCSHAVEHTSQESMVKSFAKRATLRRLRGR